jgi:hypothetical protein
LQYVEQARYDDEKKEKTVEEVSDDSLKILWPLGKEEPTTAILAIIEQVG